MRQPQLLVLDEATSQLDPVAAAAVMRDVRALGTARQLAVIAVLHDVQLAERFADQHLHLADGRVSSRVTGQFASQLLGQLLSQLVGQRWHSWPAAHNRQPQRWMIGLYLGSRGSRSVLRRWHWRCRASWSSHVARSCLPSRPARPPCAGAAATMWLIGQISSSHVHNDWRFHIGAVIGGLAGTALSWQGGNERAGWLFAMTSAATLLLVANSPFGMHDVIALQHSNALLATPLELTVFIVLAVAGMGFIAWHHQLLRLLAIDPGHAARCGIATKRWNLVLGA